MHLPQIRIQSSPLKHELRIQQPVQKLEQPQAKLSIEQPAAILEISTTRGSFEMDSTECRAELDLKSTARRVRDEADYANSKVIESVGEIAAEGDALMRIENKGTPIADIGEQAAFRPQYDINIRYAPSFGSFKMNYMPGKVDINVQKQKPKIDVETQKPIHEYTPGKTT
ncbi:MAG: DUF6470 family protein, partial [Bacilli bacterium]